MKKLLFIIGFVFAFLLTSNNISALPWTGIIIGNQQNKYVQPTQYAWFEITDRTHSGENTGNANPNGCFTAVARSRGTSASATANGCYINVLSRKKNSHRCVHWK